MVDQDGGLRERVVALTGLIATLDRRLVDAFETLDRVNAASAQLDELLDEGTDLVGDLRDRMDRLEARLNADLDEIKGAVMAKIGDLDIDSAKNRVDRLESSVQNIERAVTRVDGLIEGVVDTVPDFITRRVRSKADRVEQAFPEDARELPPVEP